MKAKGTEVDGHPYFSCVWMHSVLKLLSGGTPLHFKLRMVYSRATWVRCCRKVSDILPPYHTRHKAGPLRYKMSKSVFGIKRLKKEK